MNTIELIWTGMCIGVGIWGSLIMIILAGLFFFGMMAWRGK